MLPDSILQVSNKVRSIVDSRGIDERDVKAIIQIFGEVMADTFGHQEVAVVGAEWAKNAMKNDTAKFSVLMGELVSKMAEISQVHQDISKVSGDLVKIGVDQIVETENGRTILQDLEFANSEKMLADLRAELSAGKGILLLDNIKSPERRKDGALSQLAKYEGYILFAVPQQGGEFVVRTFMPSVSSTLTLVENIEFVIDFDALMLAYSDNIKTIRQISYVDGEVDGKLLASLEDVKFASRNEEKHERINTFLDIQNKLGYELKSIKIDERPETITNPATKEDENIFVTNLQFTMFKKGQPVVIGDEAIDELKVIGLRINEYEDDSKLNDGKLDVRTFVEGNGWQLERNLMNETIEKLKKFSNENWNSMVKHLK